MAASAADLDAIDPPCTAITDTEKVAGETASARQLGYDGKMAIHPDQVDVINRASTSDPEEVTWAKKVSSAAERAEDAEQGVFRVDGEMIDMPLIKRAETVLERHRIANTNK